MDNYLGLTEEQRQKILNEPILNHARQSLSIDSVIDKTKEVMEQNDKIAAHLVKTMEMACKGKKKRKGKGK